MQPERRGLFVRLSDRAKRCQNCIRWTQEDKDALEAMTVQMALATLSPRRLHDVHPVPTPHRAFPGGEKPQLDLLRGLAAVGALGRCSFSSPPPEWSGDKPWAGYQHAAFVCSRWTGRVVPDAGATELPEEAEERLKPR